jgi:hypothetical protein
MRTGGTLLCGSRERLARYLTPAEAPLKSRPFCFSKIGTRAGDNSGWLVDFVSIFQNNGATRGASRLTEGVFRRIGLRLGVGSGARGQGPIPFALGRPRDPPRALRPAMMPSEEGEGARWSNRRRGEAPRGERPTSLGAKHLGQVLLACRVMAREGCGDPHPRFSALRFPPVRGNGRRDDRSPDERQRHPGHGEGTQSPARNGCRDHRDDRWEGRSVGCLTS